MKTNFTHGFRAMLIAALLVGVGVLQPAPLQASPTADLSIYENALAAGWENWSWQTTANFGTPSPARGSASVSVKYEAAWAGFSVRAPSAIDTSTNAYTAITFWAYGAAGGTPFQFFTQASDGGGESGKVILTAPASAWQQFTVTLAALGNPAALARLNWQDGAGTAQPAFYLDEIRLVANGGPMSPASTATPVMPTPPTSSLTADIRVQAGAPGTSISPIALGSNLPAWVNPTNMADSVLRIRAMNSGAQVLRIPGGSWSDDYHWLGCELKRADCTTGTWASRPTDFINFLRATGRTPMYTMNINVTSKEAAAAVAFFNSVITNTTPIGIDLRGTDWYTAGHWAQLRAANGNVEPFKIAYWEFGNEIYGGKSGPKDCVSYGWETAWTCDGTEYVNGVGAGAARHEGYLEFRAAMQAIDPTIVLGAVGTEDPAGWSNWTNEVIAAAGGQLDFLVVHPYAYFDLPSNTEILAKPQNHLGLIKQSLQAALGTNPAPIALTEFNVVSVQDKDTNQLMKRQINALFMADSIGQALQNNYLTVLQWAFVNGAAGNGTDYGLVQVDNGWFRAPAYYVYPLWARFGATMLPVTTTMNTASQLSVYAGRTDANTVSLLAINKTASAITGTLSLDGVTQIASGVADVLAPAGSPASLMAQSATFNGNANPANDLADAPSTVLGAGGGASTSHVFAPYSITLLRLKTSATQLPNTPTPAATRSATPTQTQTPRPTLTPDPRLTLRTWMPLLMRD